MGLRENSFKKYPNEYFIETGSYFGGGILLAIEAKFKNIISIELSEKYYNICKENFKQHDNVHLYLDSSEKTLKDILKDIDKPITFWLDGHYSGGDTGRGELISPLMLELEEIGNHHIKNHTILIDDLRLWKKPDVDFDVEDIINKLKDINPSYVIDYVHGHVDNDVLVAMVNK